MPRKLNLTNLVVVLMSLLLGAIAPVNLLSAAEKCQAFEAVGGNGTTQTKTVTPPSVPFVPFVPFVSFSNNWNTDFAVPGGRTFKQYLVTIKPESNVTYSIELNLKYSNNTFDQFYKQTTDIKAGETLKISATPRSSSEPYQVNALIGGVENATGTTYQLTVYGCN